MLDKAKQNKIWQLYGAGVLVYVVLIVLALVVMKQNSFNVTTSYLTNNNLSSQMSTIFAPAASTLWTIQYRYLLVAILILSLIVPSLYAFWIKSGKSKIDFHKARWIDCAISSAMIMVVITLLCSLQDIMTIVLIAGLVVIGCGLFWIATHQYSVSRAIYNKTFLLGIFCVALPWVLTALYISGTWVYGDIRSPWYTYALCLVGVINTAVIIYGPLWHQTRKSRQSPLAQEAYPIMVGQVVRVAFSLILIIGMR